MGVIENPLKRAGDVPRQGSSGGQNACRSKEKEPYRDILTLDQVALLTRLLQALLGRLFCFLTVVLVFSH
jgi:hypothetical protein